MTATENGVPARRGRPGHSLDSLLDVAVAVFNERGYDATSMDELAVRLGITKSAIYHHVPSKVELLALRRRREFDRIVTDLVRAAEEQGDVRPDVDPAVTSRLLFGTVNSLTEWYRPDGGLSADALADALVATTFDGLRTR
jgi:AcrR family transcriptional regulator